MFHFINKQFAMLHRNDQKYIYRDLLWTLWSTRDINQITWTIAIQELDKFDEKIEENANRTEIGKAKP